MNTKSSLLTLSLLGLISFSTENYADDLHTPSPAKAALTNTTPGYSDADLISKVHASLAEQKSLSDLNLVVTCRQGIVTVKGQVTSKPQLDQVLELINSIAGVKQVQSELTLENK